MLSVRMIILSDNGWLCQQARFFSMNESELSVIDILNFDLCLSTAPTVPVIS